MIETKMKWFNVQDELPQDEVNVLCFHEPSKNYFISHRTKDCLSGEPKWFSGDMPTHWMPLPEGPIVNAGGNAMLAELLSVKKNLFEIRKSINVSYRQWFGFENPPAKTKLKIDFSEGLGFFVIWKNCPDYANIIEGWFKNRQQAIDYITKNNWQYE